MTVGVLTVSLIIPNAVSLKDKRKIIQSIKDRVLGSMNFSVAEIEHQDKWQLAKIAFVTVASERKPVEERIAQLIRWLESDKRITVNSFSTQYL